MSPKQWTVLVVLSLATIWSFVSLKSLADSLREAQKVVLPEVDYQLFGVRMEQYGKDTGLREISINAPRMVHQRVAQRVLIGAPVFESFAAEGQISATAADATFERSTKMAQLSGGVLMRKAANDGDVRARMDSLRVDLDAQTANSDDPVDIVQGKSTLRGDGLEVDLKLEQFKLRGNVQGTFYPARRKKTN